MTTMIRYDGQIAAFAGARRCHLAFWVAQRPAGDPDLRMVAVMCLFAMDVNAGLAPAGYSDELALLFARCVLIDDLEFGVYGDEDDAALAERFGVPVAQIAAKRIDICRAAKMSEAA